jgi:YggT family protein
MQAINFLLDAVVSFFCVLFLLRFMMQAMRVSFAGQLGNFVVALTNWAVKPLRRIIPGLGGLDWSSLFAALVLQLVLAGVLIGLSGQLIESDGATLAMMIGWFALRGLLRMAVYILIGALILQAVLSWINPYSPLSAPAHQLTRPLLDPIRRVVPLISGIDLSPLVAILLLQVVLMFL